MSYSTVPSDLVFPLPATIKVNYNNGSNFSTGGAFTLRSGATTLSTVSVKVGDSNNIYGPFNSGDTIMYTMAVDNNNRIYLFYRRYVYETAVHTNNFAVYNATTYAGIYSTALPYASTKLGPYRLDAYGNSYFSSNYNSVYTPYMNIYNYSAFLLCVSTIDYSLTTIPMPGGGNSVTGDNNGNLYFTSIASKDITRYNIGSGTSTTFFSNPSLIAGGFLVNCFISNDGFFYALDNAGNIYKISSNGSTCTLFLSASSTQGAKSMGYNSTNGNIYVFNVIGDGNCIVYEVTPSATATLIRSGLAGSIRNVGNASYLSNFYNVYDNSLYWAKFNDGGEKRVYSNNITFITSILSFSNVSTNLFIKGNNTLQIYKDGVAFGNPIVIGIPCFLQGTKILRMNQETDDEEYVPVETLRRGDIIKTVNHGYKAIELIGSKEIPAPLAIEKESSRLYWFRKSKISGLREDLCVTGDHCILHKSITDSKKDQVLGYMGDIYITEGHYRVPAFLDDHSEPYEDSAPATIWHFALENPNIYHNYGVYANGLLVESSSLHYMYEYSNMKLID